MITKYGIDINNKNIQANFNRIGNQIFKLLPMREEGKNWIKPLETLTVEVIGWCSLLPDQKDLLALCAKLEGLKACGEDSDFKFYRRVIFEACSLVDKIKNELE